MDMSELKPAKELAAKRVSRFMNETADYAEARTALLVEEIEVRRHLARLAEQRRRLPPGPLVQKDYRSKDENGEELGLADVLLDVRPATGTALSDVHELPRWSERQWRRRQTEGRIQDYRSQRGGAATCVRYRTQLA
ncbi:hypothetical protein FHX03_006474 [Rhizobium sp. BK456]|nr:hypothetical protein [Rhizobium sp. BK456]